MTEQAERTARHTPGPWSVWMAGEQLMVTADARHYPEIAYLGPDRNAGENSFSDEEEANARLIAAAPDLLAALRVIVFLGEDDEHAPEMAWKDAFAAGATPGAQAEGQATP